MSTDPLALRRAATVLGQQAGRIGSTLDRVAAASGPAVWHGPAADRFAQDLRHQRAKLAEVADRLAALQRRLHHEADVIERTRTPPA